MPRPITHRRNRTLAGLLGTSLLAASSAGSLEADAERGRLLIARYPCGSCHTIPGIPDAQGDLAQALNAYGRRSYIAGRLPNNPEMLALWLLDPPALIPGTRMPKLGVAPQDARDMAAWLKQQR